MATPRDLKKLEELPYPTWEQINERIMMDGCKRDPDYSTYSRPYYSLEEEYKREDDSMRRENL